MPERPKFDTDALDLMNVLRTKYRYSWARIAEVVGSSPGRVKRVLEVHEQRRMRARASSGPQPLMRDCFYCLSDDQPPEAVCTYPCPRAIAHSGGPRWMHRDLRGKRT